MLKETIQIKGAPLFKFQSADRIESFQKGLIYAKTLAYYRELEKTTGDDTIGDSFEGMLHVNDATMRNMDTGEVFTLNDELISTVASDNFAFCMFGIDIRSQEFQFSEIQKKELLSFGDTALVILDFDEFVKRVKSAGKKAGFTVLFDSVKYYDPTVDNASMIISLLQNMQNIGFWKREKYVYQQECRFIFSPVSKRLNPEDHIELNIGDISDISRVFPSVSALTGIVSKQ